MITYRQALDLILALPFDAGMEMCPLLDSVDRFLAEPVGAPWPMPRFDNSSMDGFAARAEDLHDATTDHPARLSIVGESAAGRAFAGEAAPRTAIRISTGAPVPPGYDAIIPIENARLVGERDVEFPAPAVAGRYIRRRASDVAEGQALFARGARVTPAVLAFLASFNIPAVRVARRPRVAILTGGDEIVAHGAPLGEGQIVGSSLYYLDAELRACGCEPRVFGIARDHLPDLRALFSEALAWGDILVTTAGVSVGPHDLMGRVVEELGGTTILHQVAIRPGKPMLVATYGAKVHFGFPGNPVSTCCNFEIFLKPFLRRAFGIEPTVRPTETRIAAGRFDADPRRLFFVYTIIDGDTARPLPNQNSANLLLPAMANALAIIKPGDTVETGEAVEVLRVGE